MRFLAPVTAIAVASLVSVSGPAVAAEPAASSANVVTPATHGQSRKGDDAYYLRRIPGTNKARKVYYFEQLDRDGDGELSRPELPHAMRNLRLHFIQADWNGNGSVSPGEYQHYRQGTTPRYTAISHGLVVQVHE